MLAAQVGQIAQGLIAGLNAQGLDSGTALSNLTFSIEDPTLATAVLDPTTPNAIDVTIVGIGTTTPGMTLIQFQATATDTDGTVSTVTGEDVIYSSTPGGGGENPPPQRTVGLGVTWSVPTTGAPPAATASFRTRFAKK